MIGSAFCYEKREKVIQQKEKAPKRDKKEYDKKRIVEILVFGVCIQLRRIVLRGVQWEQIKPNSSFFLSVTEFFYVQGERKKEELCFYVLLSPRQKTSKAIIFLKYAKYSLYLNGSVHAKKRPFLARQSLQYFGTIFVEY